MSRITVLFSLLALAACFAGCTPPPPPPEPVRAVRTLTVEVGRTESAHAFAAEVRARHESRLGFRVAGKLLSRSAEVGQRVSAGQVLARLDPTDLQLAQTSAQAALRSAESALALSRAEFERFQSLRVQGFISALELERRATSLQAQQALADQARSLAAQQGNLAAYAVLTAPVAGVVTAVEAEIGTVLAAGTPVLRLAHEGARDVVFSVPEDALEGVQALLGQAGAVQVRPWGAVDLLPATMRELAAMADPQTRTYAVKADLGAAALPLGRTVTVLLPGASREGVVRLPLPAVVGQGGQSAVWVLDRASMTVRPQPVQVDGAQGNWAIVRSGLQAGQTVVTAGVHTLTAGQKVKFYEGDAPPVGEGLQ